MGAHPGIAARALAPVCLGALAVTGCGSGPRQDASEPNANFPVQVISASFPAKQRLATTSNMTVVVRNPGPQRIPIVSVTVKCPGTGPNADPGGFTYKTSFPGVADSARPRFVINTVPTRTPRQYDKGRLDPLERSSAYVDTYPLGPLDAGRTVTFVWSVTAVKSGPYRICYRVNAGLSGKARAVPVGAGERIDGQFSGTIAQKPPQAHIGPDGKTVVEGTAMSGSTP
jgi:hypothetical protein